MWYLLWVGVDLVSPAVGTRRTKHTQFQHNRELHYETLIYMYAAVAVEHAVSSG